MIEEYVEECKMIFNKITQGSNEKIRADLIYTKLENIGIHLNFLEFQDLLNEIVESHSIEIDLNEFSIIWYHLIRIHSQSDINYIEIWENIDTAKSGFIQTSDILKSIKQNDSSITEQDLLKLIQDSTLQKDDQINYNQFWQYIQSL